jgi:putative transposase
VPPPRQFLEGTTYMVTRRTERRHHLFRPDAVMNQGFLYCVGYAAMRSGVTLHAGCLLSNHYHIVLTDEHGLAPIFTQTLNLLLTQFAQVHRGWVGRVFDAEGPSYTELLTEGAIADKIGYTLANPTSSGLVRFSEEWPGVRTRVREIGNGRTLVIARPQVYFGDNSMMPAEVELRLEMPERLAEKYGRVETARAEIETKIDEKEREARKGIADAGSSFMGRERVLYVSPYSRAKTYEERGNLNPQFAGSRAAIDAAVERRDDFLERYHHCRSDWCADRRDLVWPEGTFFMRQYHHVRVGDPPA